jgi:hypothetical protein
MYAIVRAVGVSVTGIGGPRRRLYAASRSARQGGLASGADPLDDATAPRESVMVLVEPYLATPDSREQHAETRVVGLGDPLVGDRVCVGEPHDLTGTDTSHAKRDTVAVLEHDGPSGVGVVDP